MKPRAGLLFLGVALGGLASAGARAADLLVVLNKSDDTASILDARSGAVRATVPVGHGPHEVAVLADGRTAAVSNYGTRSEPGRSLTLIDLERNAAKGTVDLPEGTRPHGLEPLRDGRLLVTAEGLKELLIVIPRPGESLRGCPPGKRSATWSSPRRTAAAPTSPTSAQVP